MGAVLPKIKILGPPQTDRQTVIIGTGPATPTTFSRAAPTGYTRAPGARAGTASLVGRALLRLTPSVAHPLHAPYDSGDSRGVGIAIVVMLVGRQVKERDTAAAPLRVEVVGVPAEKCAPPPPCRTLSLVGARTVKANQ